MIRRWLSIFGLALLALGGGLVAQPTHAGAASMTKVGWWYRTSDPRSLIPRMASSPLVPDVRSATVAPPVADGDLLVEGTPEGATAIAAITYELDGAESGPVLTIKPSDDSFVPEDLLILACRAAVAWVTPKANPGAWQDKPLVDCSRSVNGIGNEDGKITFPLQPLVGGPQLDVVLVPGVITDAPGGKIGSTFSLRFSAAHGATLGTTKAPVAAPKDAAQSQFASPPHADSSIGPGFVAPLTPVVEPALEPQEQAPTVPHMPTPATVRAVGDSDARRVGLVILLIGGALVALTSVFTSGTNGDTVGLGRFRRSRPAVADKATTVGGLGHFARPRTGVPPALS